MKSEDSFQIFQKNIKKPNPSIIRRRRLILLIWKIIWIPYSCAIIELIVITFQIALQPFLLEKLMDFVSEDTLARNEEQIWHGIVYAVFYSLAALISRTTEAHVGSFLHIASNRVKTALITSIYDKMLKLSPSARKEYTSGKKSINLHSNLHCLKIGNV